MQQSETTFDLNQPAMLNSQQPVPLKYLETRGASVGQSPTFNGTTVVWDSGSGLPSAPDTGIQYNNAGAFYADGLATRDPITNQTYIGYRTGAGQFTNALKLGNFLGTLIPDGVGFERHDAVGDNFTFSTAVDGTPVGSTANSLLHGYGDLTNGIYATGMYNANGLALDYANQSIGVGGTLSVNDTDAYMAYGDGSTFQSHLSLGQNGAGFRYEDLGSGRVMENKVDQTRAIAGNFDGSGNSMSWQLDDFNRYFNVFGLYNAGTDTYGDMLKLDASTGIMGFGDVLKIDSHIGIFANNSNGTAYIDGFKTTIPGWTPSLLSDGFSGTGLNDMFYDSTVTYNGAYPNTYNATIATVNSVYMQLVSISTPGFNIGDTVTDGSGSTATVIAGGDVDGFIVVQPIVDTGWTSATAISDISTGAASTVSGVIYTDTFSWTATAGGGAVLVPCNTFVALNKGLTVGFSSPTGHTVGDTWTWDMFANYSYSKIALFDGDGNNVVLGDADSEGNRTSLGIFDRSREANLNSLGKVSLGAVYDVLTRILIDVSGKKIQNYTEGTFKISDIYGNKEVFITNPNTGFVHLGDNGLGNRTFIELDDIAQTITINNVQSYADDAAAIGAGLTTGNVYKTTTGGSTFLKIVP